MGGFCPPYLEEIIMWWIYIVLFLVCCGFGGLVYLRYLNSLLKCNMENVEKVYCSECIYSQRIYGIDKCVHPNSRRGETTGGNPEYPPKTFYYYTIQSRKRNKHNDCPYYKRGEPQPMIIGERDPTELIYF